MMYGRLKIATLPVGGVKKTSSRKLYQWFFSDTNNPQ